MFILKTFDDKYTIKQCIYFFKPVNRIEWVVVAWS